MPSRSTSSSLIVGVAGGGLLGAGIAVQFARQGHLTRVVDPDPEAAARILAQAASILDELASWGTLGAADRDNVARCLSIHTDLGALKNAGLVIEAIPEVLEVKHAFYRELEPLLARDAIIGSNTSGFTPQALATALARPERFLITHFWNAPHTVPLVEVVPGERTVPEVIETVMACLTQIGNEPLLLRRAIPGFIGNRIQYAALREALHIVAQGVASPQDVDRVVCATLGRRYPYAGPFAIADAGGLATFLSISSHLFPELAGEHDASGLALLREVVEQGHRGQRSGVGFYRWSDDKLQRFAQARQRTLQSAANAEPWDTPTGGN